VLNQNIAKSIELKLAEAKSLAEQVDDNATLLYLIDMIVSEARSISSGRASAEGERDSTPSGLPRLPKIRLVS
jgi:hypothetical protein